ncbi:MAG: Uma2 family endonuclease [Merismopedia sp. SIO2A8]|nr:Uma2 family endonuclease [Symploca sp. SIO2B6]NET51577.1 Uma2 family endonuclease [Merismopedia sp. SIO2A8]
MVTTPSRTDTGTELMDIEVPTPPTNLPYDDAEPLETPKHRVTMNALIRCCHRHLSQQNLDFYCGGNMFLYYSEAQVKNQDFRGPDFFVVLEVEGENQRGRKYWAIWEEGGRYPDVIIELMSQSTAQVDTTTKKRLYERTFRTRDYLVYDPYDPSSLRGWSLDSTLNYQPLEPNDRGWLWCQTLGLWLGSWEGEIQSLSGVWLRFYDAEGELVLLPEEAERVERDKESQLAQQERQRAQAAEQRARSMEAENERLRALLRQQGIEFK